MMEEYKAALRAGQRAYRACVARGQSPYLAVLDDILMNVNIVSQEDLGLISIPAESIVGTKTSGRHTAFAPNFMPLLGPETEFASKWSVLCDSHLSEGIHTPVIAYEFLNRFYIQEGNKRVSVLKHFGAASIPGTVIRLIPPRTDSDESRIYYEFLDFYKLSQINNVHFSRPGSYAKLQKLLCKAAQESWTDEDRRNFRSFYPMFRQQFQALGGGRLPLTTGDALLVYLSVYRYSDACQATPAQLKEQLTKLWNEILVLTEPQAVELMLEPPAAREPLLPKLSVRIPRGGELKVAFLHEHDAKSSPWVRAHQEACPVLSSVFQDRVILTTREGVDPFVDAEQVIEELAHGGADVIFTSSIRMHTACLKVAAQHPKTKFLNCSLNGPHPLVRTYYPRTYEATYLLGILAGVMSPTNWVGYVATNPIYGVPAAINAFAQGLKSVRPEGRILLRWACLPNPDEPLDFSDRPEITVFYARDNREAPGVYRDYGLCKRLPSGLLRALGLPVWRWDVFYQEIIRSILDGTWDSAANNRAINYWWGLKSGAIELSYNADLPGGTLQLLDLVEKQLQDGMLHIFPARTYAQGHRLCTPEGAGYSPKELMEMDWLDECVEGGLPHYDELDVKTRFLMEINGLDIIKQAAAGQ